MVSSSWDAEQILRAGMAAERSNLDFFLVTDHYLTQHGNKTTDAWTVLSALAIKTKKICIGTCVSPIPLRPPTILAKVVSTVDIISGGRTILGVGAGWYKPEFTAYSSWDDDNIRVSKTIEGVRLILKLWTEQEPFDFQGKFYKVEGAVLEPKPIRRPHPPLWFGVLGQRMLRAAASYAEAWVPPVPGISLHEYRHVISSLRKFQQEIRRDRPVKVYFNGTFEEIVKNIEAFKEVGCEGAILARTPFEKVISSMKMLARDVVPSYR